MDPNSTVPENQPQPSPSPSPPSAQTPPPAPTPPPTPPIPPVQAQPVQPPTTLQPTIPPRPTPPPAPPPVPPDDLREKTFGSDAEDGGSGWLGVLKFIVNWVIIPLVIVYLFQAFIFQAFYVSGQSMEPTFQDGDYLVISKIGVTSKNLRKLFNHNATINYQRGDVLVFRPPIATSTFYIKRLIGLPGERVVIKNGNVTIYNSTHPQGFVLHESYIDQSALTQGDIDVTVDRDKFFVLGDNREPSGSYDSRSWGQLPQFDVTGRVVIRLLPLNRFRIIGHVNYGFIADPLLRLPLVQNLARDLR